MDSHPPAAIDVSASLVFRDETLLITKRHDDVHLGGLWGFPGGKREPNETFEQCLLRELREELGIDVTIKDLVESVTHQYPERTVHLKFFRCAWLRHEPRPLGCVDLAWVRAGELSSYHFPEADATLLEKLRNSPELWRNIHYAVTKSPDKPA